MSGNEYTLIGPGTPRFEAQCGGIVLLASVPRLTFPLAWGFADVDDGCRGVARSAGAVLLPQRVTRGLG